MEDGSHEDEQSSHSSSGTSISEECDQESNSGTIPSPRHNFLERRSNRNLDHGPVTRCTSCVAQQGRGCRCRWTCRCSVIPFPTYLSFRNHLKWDAQNAPLEVYVHFLF